MDRGGQVWGRTHDLWSIVGEIPHDFESGKIVQVFFILSICLVISISSSALFARLAAGGPPALHALILDVFNPLRCLSASFLE